MSFGLTYLKNVATLKLSTDKCIGCGMCEKVCPHNVFFIAKYVKNNEKKAVIQNLDACIECGACVRNCPPEALSVKPGTGCAAAILKGMIKKTEPSCDCNAC